MTAKLCRLAIWHRCTLIGSQSQGCPPNQPDTVGEFGIAPPFSARTVLRDRQRRDEEGPLLLPDGHSSRLDEFANGIRLVTDRPEFVRQPWQPHGNVDRMIVGWEDEPNGFGERTRAGLAAGAARERKGGRKSAVTEHKLGRAREHTAKGLAVRDAAVRVKVGKPDPRRLAQRPAPPNGPC